MIDVRVLDVRPHPDQATNNPGCWGIQLAVTHDGTTRTFWRWHSTYELRDGRRIPTDQKPRIADIIKRFWDDTFAELHGFSFDKDDP